MIIWDIAAKFTLDGQRWKIRRGVDLKNSGAVDRVTINNRHVADFAHDRGDAEALRTHSLKFRHDGHDFRVDFGPAGWIPYAAHVFRDGTLVHRHKDRDFAQFPRLEAWMDKIDAKSSAKDDRAWWKDLLEAVIIGGLAGVAFGILESVLERRGLINPALDLSAWLIGPVILFIILKPKRWTFIR